MNHQGTKELETERLILRSFSIDDAGAMYKNWASDPKVTKFLTWPPHESVEATKEFLSTWVANYKKKDFYQWAIVPKELGEPIGSISVVAIDEAVSSLHIGYCIGKKWWRKGITSESLAAVMDYLFDEVKAKRIESAHDVNNPNSGKVMKKCGMKYEGCLRGFGKSNQGIIDVCFYGILRSDRE